MLDQSRIGRILTGDARGAEKWPAGQGDADPEHQSDDGGAGAGAGAPGFAREDLFTVVHEQFMTETAQMADIVLPATMFLEHDDLYYGGGHQHISVGAKLIEPPGECRSNHEVLPGLARRLKA